MYTNLFRLRFLQLLLGKYRLKLEPSGLVLNSRRLPFPQHNDRCYLSTGPLLIHLRWGEHRYLFWPQEKLMDFLRHAISERDSFWQEQFLASYQRLSDYADQFELRFNARNRYIRSSQLEQVLQLYPQLDADLEQLPTLAAVGFDTQTIEHKLNFYLYQPSSFRDRFNAQWRQRQLAKNEALFDSLEQHPLTTAQRMACVEDEDNILVIAGAGTGKTSTMIAKACYLVKNGLATPSEILMLAFGKDAQAELAERAAQHSAIEGVKISTFHSAGFKAVSSCEDGISLSTFATDESAILRFVEQQIEAMLESNAEAANLKQFVEQYYYPKPDDIDSCSQADYNAYVRNAEIRALSGDLLKSFEALSIANYLYCNGFAFEYKAAYPHDCSEPGRKSYRPDFYLPDLDVYIEHFDINQDGETRPDIDDESYAENMQWKIDTHDKHGTVILQTFSYQSSEPGGLAQALEWCLQEHCEEQDLDFEALLDPISEPQLFSLLKEQGVISRLVRLMSQFLALFKASSQRLEALSFDQISDYNLERWSLFKQIFQWVYARYQATLEANHSIDFADMINRATAHAQSPSFHQKTQNAFRIKYLLVDEFQDISRSRAAFVQAIRHSNDDCCLMGVGDDWQAIYRFAGSDLRLTTQFDQFFGTSSVINLDKTFRFNDRIERVASTFVQANPHQLKKSLTTLSKSALPEVSIISLKPDVALAHAFAQIAKRTQASAKSASVLVLGRYKHCIPKDIQQSYQHYPQLSVRAMTVHQSKGKQADYVIVMDAVDGAYGFPSKQATDPLLETMLPKLENYPHAEERRLFYVALSRARQSVFVLTELGKASVFVNELKQQKNDVLQYVSQLESAFVDSAHCPACHLGQLIPVEGKYGLFYACSQPKSFCEHIVPACNSCKKGPLMPTETAYVCAAPHCDNSIERCPNCSTGMLIERENTRDNSRFLGCSNFHKKGDDNCRYTRSVATR